jgi:magnesium chelatase subunit D
VADAADAAQVQRWSDALQAAVLLALDPAGLGGVRLRAAPDERRDQWVALLRAALPPAAPLLRMPLHISDERLLGGIDLGGTLQTGRVVLQPGLLARADGGVVLVAMAERLSAATAARLAAVMDTRQLALQREGRSAVVPARIGVVALDEGAASDESLPPALAERLGIHIDLDALPLPREGLGVSAPDPAELAAARARLGAVHVDDAVVQVICETAAVLGVDSLRAPIFALQLARAAAAWDGRDVVETEDVALAARLVLAPRATRLPAPPQDEQPADAAPPPPPPPPEDATPPEHEDEQRAVPDDEPLQDQVLQAALAAIPPGLLAMLVSAGAAKAAAGGRAGAMQASRLRGRPYGSRRGDPRGGARLHLIDTLRAAAPWQGVRRRERPADAAAGPSVLVRRDDFHVTRFRQRRESTTIFVVDASGSAALHRLAEAKGAVELLLADCYVRRDRVALIAFRGAPGGAPGAELLLPPTRSLVRAKRCLAALPGGGGTPLAAGLDAARQLAEDVARRGGTPLVVLLTDGRANIARDGSPGRPQATEDALASARLWVAGGLSALWLDTSPQPQESAQRIALAMGARYLPLPHADASRLSQAVRAAST